MRIRSIAAVVASALLVLGAAGCGDDDGGDDTASSTTAEDANGGDSPGAELADDVAAEVGGESIGAEQIEEEASALAASPQLSDQLEESGDEAEGLLRAEVLTYAIQAQLLSGAAESLDAPVTDEDIAEARTQLEDEAGGADALAESLESQGFSDAFLGQQVRAIAAQNNIEAAVAEQSGGESPESTGPTTTGPNGQAPPSPAEQAVGQYLTEYLSGIDVVVNDDFGTWDAQSARVVPPGGLPGAGGGGLPTPSPGGGGSGGSSGSGGGSGSGG